jgi:Bacterial extracellular solute-binding proteins, family 3
MVTAELAPTGTPLAAINLGNPVLAQGDPEHPAGVTVDLARELAGRLGVPVSFVCFDAARKSFEALTSGAADVRFLAIEPAREAEVSFTAPYVLIEGNRRAPVHGDPSRGRDHQGAKRRGDDVPARCGEELKAGGVVAEALERSGQDTTVATPG